ncbi:MAG: PQQ-binding-like beta-propeller repeat protein, partial [Candidatus Rokuibacteriota bacterium]
MRFLIRLLAVALCIDAGGARADERAGAEWPGWRGPGQAGSVNRGTFPFAPGDGLRVRWKRQLGTGYSSVSVVRGHAVTLFGDGRHDHVISLEPRTGREQWRFRMGPTFKAPIQSNEGPLSTPVIHQGRVFALGPHGRLVALDLDTGRLAWSRDLVADFGAEVPYFGFATSPLAFGARVYVESGGRSASLVAFDAETGATVWSAGEDSVTYQSPVAATLAGETQIVFAGDTHLHGVRPDTGEILWTREHGVRADPEAVKQIVLGPGDLNPISPVIVGDDGVLLTNYYGATSVLFRVSRAGAAYEVSEAWRNTNIRKTYTVPIVAGDHLYG